MFQIVSKRGRPRSTGSSIRGTRGSAKRARTTHNQSKSDTFTSHTQSEFLSSTKTEPPAYVHPEPPFLDTYVSGTNGLSSSENDASFSSEFWNSGGLGSSRDYLADFGAGFSSPCVSYDEKVFWDPILEAPGIELECESSVLETETTGIESMANIKVEQMEACSSWDNQFDTLQSVKDDMEDTKPDLNADSEATSSSDKQCLKHLTAYEEFQLMKRLEHSKVTLENSTEARQLLRKLQLRHMRRTKELPQFEFDKLVKRLAGDLQNAGEIETADGEKQADTRVLDRFQTKPSTNLYGRQHTSFRTRLLGSEENVEKTFVSPYTKRTLKTVIWRDHEARPLKLRILQDILSAHLNKDKRGGDHPCSFVPEKVPVGCIEYQYIRPHHIAYINSLAKEFFWPGIDVSDCLQYPDFTCVALYKKIIIGFAIMVPDVRFNEAYISFLFTHPEWRNAGISTFMIYHLIQTSLGKDITLHVEATNPAVFLYQKFCFKIEEFLVDFYDKYLPPNLTQCKHALFMRLSR